MMTSVEKTELLTDVGPGRDVLDTTVFEDWVLLDHIFNITMASGLYESIPGTHDSYKGAVK